MKVSLIILLLWTLVYNQARAQNSSGNASQSSYADSLLHYDRILSTHELEHDLMLFRAITEKANSGLYRYRTRRQWDSAYRSAFGKIQKPRSTSDFYKIILELTDFEGSCHNYTELSEDHLAFLRRQKTFFPFALKYIEGKIIFNNNTNEIPVGSRILSINGVSDTALMRSFYKYITADGFTVTEKLSGSVNNSFGVRYVLEYGLTDSFNIRFTRPYSSATDSAIFSAVYETERDEIVASRHSATVDSITNYQEHTKYSFRMVDSTTGLLNLRIFSMATGKDDPAFSVYVSFIDSVFRHLDKYGVRNLILDIRNNPGGSDPLFEQPMMYLADKPFKENVMAYTIFDSLPYEQHFWGVSTDHKMDSVELVAGKQFLKDYFPALKDGKNFQHPKHNPVYYPKEPGFKGGFYLLIDEGVASAGSHLASLVKAYARNVTIIGVETTGGYYGHNGHIPVVYQLPNSKLKTKFSIVYVVQDAPVMKDQPEGRGVIPDFEVWPTFDDFMNNRDTQMEFVKKLIASPDLHKKKKILAH